MSLEITVDLKGLPELLQSLDKMGQAADQALRPAVEEGAEILRVDAASRAPRATGALADGMTKEVVKAEAHEVKFKVGPDKKQFYGRFVENGTVNLAPRPFLKPALTANRKRITDLIQERIRQSIAKQ